MWIRLGRRVLTLLLAGFLGAMLVRIAPGFGTDEREMDARLSAASLEEIRRSAGAGRDVLSFYAGYLRKAATGDLGYSRLFDRPVLALAKERFATTMESVGIGWLAGIAAGLMLAIVVNLSANGVMETGCTAASGALLCLPAGLTGLALFHAGLPVAAGIAGIVFPKIFLYAQLLIHDGLRSPHVLASRARGAGPLRVLLVHVVWPSARTVLALAGVTLTVALGASIPLEVVCDSPGIGQLAWRAAMGRDMVLLTGLTLFVATVTIVANSLADEASERLEGGPE